jgi:hypothetical protein
VLCPSSLAKQNNNVKVIWGPEKLFYGTYGPIKFEVWHGLYTKYEIQIGSSVWTEPVDSLPTDRHFNAANTVIVGSSVRHKTFNCRFRKQKFLSLTPLQSSFSKMHVTYKLNEDTQKELPDLQQVN